MDRDYCLNGEQKKQYLHNLLAKEAARFYSDSMELNAATYQIAVDMITGQYNSAVRQGQVLDYLDGLSVDAYVEKGMDESEAWAKIYAEIVRMTPQCPVSHKNDAHRIRFMRLPVSGRLWSHPALQRVASSGLTFQQLYGELESALQLNREGLSKKTNNSSAQTPTNTEAVINYAGQGKYRRRNADFKPRHRKKKSSPLDLLGCLNCDAKDHMARYCSKPLNLPKAAERRLQCMQKKKAENPVHLVLADICMQTTEDASHYDEKTDVETGNESQVFQSVVESCFEAALAAPENDDNDGANISFVESTVLSDTFICETADQFQGACVDSGAQLTVVGKRQAEQYARTYGSNLTMKNPTVRTVLEIIDTKGSESSRSRCRRRRAT